MFSVHRQFLLLDVFPQGKTIELFASEGALSRRAIVTSERTQTAVSFMSVIVRIHLIAPAQASNPGKGLCFCMLNGAAYGLVV